MATTNNITVAQAVLDLISRDHNIDLDKAANMVNKMRINPKRVFRIRKKFAILPFNSPEMPESIAYNRQAIEGLLSSEDCIGIRIYPALNDKNQFTLLIVGMDGAGNNIMAGGGGNMLMSAAGKFVDEGQSCPPYPSSALF